MAGIAKHRGVWSLPGQGHQGTSRQRAGCAAAAAPPRLVLYTKPDCPLCDGLKVRVHAHSHQRRLDPFRTHRGGTKHEAPAVDALAAPARCAQARPRARRPQDKVAALIDRAAFMPSVLSGATLEVRPRAGRARWRSPGARNRMQGLVQPRAAA